MTDPNHAYTLYFKLNSQEDTSKTESVQFGPATVGYATDTDTETQHIFVQLEPSDAPEEVLTEYTLHLPILAGTTPTLKAISDQITAYMKLHAKPRVSATDDGWVSLAVEALESGKILQVGAHAAAVAHFERHNKKR